MNSNKRLILTPLAHIKTRKQEYLDGGELLPLGVITIFAGRGGSGKSTLALDYAARVITGTLEGELAGSPRPVLVIQHEDDPGVQLKPRLQAAGVPYDSDLLYTFNLQDITSGINDLPSLTRDVEYIKQALETLQPALVVFDPLTSCIEGDLNKVRDVRQALNPLAGLAQEFKFKLTPKSRTRL